MILKGFFVGQVPVRFVYRGGRLLYDRLDKKLALRPELQTLLVAALSGLSDSPSAPVRAEADGLMMCGEPALEASPAASGEAEEGASFTSYCDLYVKPTSHFVSQPITDIPITAQAASPDSAPGVHGQTLPVLLTAQAYSPDSAPAEWADAGAVLPEGTAQALPGQPIQWAGDGGAVYANAGIHSTPANPVASENVGEITPEGQLEAPESGAAESAEPVVVSVVAALYCHDTAWQLPELAEGTLEILQVYDAVQSGNTITIS